MKIDKLNRLGDTSFRAKNQINFYISLINCICELSYNDKEGLYTFIPKHLIYNVFINDSSDWNYKNNFNNNRASMLIKQLIRFKLLEEDNNKVRPNNLALKIFELKSRYNIFYKKTNLNLFAVVLSLLVNFNDDNLSKYFTVFLKFIMSKQEITLNEIALFSICENLEEYNLFYEKNISSKNKSTINNFVLNKLFENKLNNNKIIDFIFSIKKVSCKKKYYLHLNSFLKENGLPTFKKEPKEIQDLSIYFNILISKNIDDVESFEISNNIIKTLTNKINSTFGINLKKIDKLSNNYLIYFFKYYYLLKKYELIFGDYLDINKRWFLQMGIIKMTKNNSYQVNKEYVNLLIDIKNKYEIITDNNINNVIDFIETVFINSENNQVNEYPYTINEIIQVLEKYKESNFDIDGFIEKKLKIYNVKKHVVYEYLINLSFALSYGYSTNDFRNIYCNTLLDEELKPNCHASGGKSDGLIIDKDGDKLFSTIESTILTNSLYNEKEPIHRHSIKYFDKHKEAFDNDLPNVIFVSNRSINENDIFNFCSDSQSIAWIDRKRKVRTILLDTNIFVKLLKDNKLDRLLRSFINKIPLQDAEDIHDSLISYKNLFKDIQ